MFISKKSFNSLLEFLESSRTANAEMLLLVKKITRELDEKEQQLASYRKVTLKSHWIKTRCPHCLEDIDLHILNEEGKNDS